MPVDCKLFFQWKGHKEVIESCHRGHQLGGVCSAAVNSSDYSVELESTVHGYVKLILV